MVALSPQTSFKKCCACNFYSFAYKKGHVRVHFSSRTECVSVSFIWIVQYTMPQRRWRWRDYEYLKYPFYFVIIIVLSWCLLLAISLYFYTYNTSRHFVKRIKGPWHPQGTSYYEGFSSTFFLTKASHLRDYSRKNSVVYFLLNISQGFVFLNLLSTLLFFLNSREEPTTI